MKNIIIIIILIFSITPIFSQKICASKEEAFVDVNAINKCTVEKEVVKIKNSKAKSKYAIASSARYLKKRIYLNKVVYLASNLKTKTVTDTKIANKIDTNLLMVLEDESKKEEISFDSVEKIPLFSSCIESSLDQVDCFNNQMQEHIINNFVYPKEALKNRVEGNLEVSFVIDKNGKVNDVKVIGENNNIVLIEEAKRIVLLLPKFTPGKQKDINVNVLYKFPMNFTLD